MGRLECGEEYARRQPASRRRLVAAYTAQRRALDKHGLSVAFRPAPEGCKVSEVGVGPLRLDTAQDFAAQQKVGGCVGSTIDHMRQ